MCGHDHVDLAEERKNATCVRCAGSSARRSHWDVTCQDCGALGEWCELADEFAWATEVAPAAVFANPLPEANRGESESEFMGRCMAWMNRTSRRQDPSPWPWS